MEIHDLGRYLGVARTCKWQRKCNCAQACKFPTIRYHDAGSKETTEEWTPLNLMKTGDRMTFNARYWERKQMKDFSLVKQIRVFERWDDDAEAFRWRLASQDIESLLEFVGNINSTA